MACQREPWIHHPLQETNARRGGRAERGILPNFGQKMKTEPRPIVTQRGGAAHAWHRISGKGCRTSRRSPPNSSALPVRSRAARDCARGFRGGRSSERRRSRRVSTLAALRGDGGATDLVHPVLDGRGGRTPRRLLAHVLVRQRRIVRALEDDQPQARGHDEGLRRALPRPACPGSRGVAHSRRRTTDEDAERSGPKQRLA